MAEAAYQRAFRKAQVALAQQQGKQDAMRAAGIEPQQQQQQQQQATKAKTPPRAPAAKNQRAARRKPASRR